VFSARLLTVTFTTAVFEACSYKPAPKTIRIVQVEQIASMLSPTGMLA
jgi:hypothetical protein